MSALADAIRRGRPRSDLDRQSPFHGLRRRHAGTVDVMAQSVAATAPAGVLLVHPGSLSERTGSFAFLDLIVTVALVMGIALVIGIFARRISSTGSLYTYAARGLGPQVGILAGGALAMGYLAIAMNTLWSGSGRIARVIAAPVANELTPVVILVFGVVTALVIGRGLRSSTRVLLVLEVAAVATVLTLSVIALAMTQWDLALLVPRIEGLSPDAIVTGVAFAIIGFVGFESGAALGPETRRPHAMVPRAILLSAGATGLVLLISMAAQLSLVADSGDQDTLGAVLGLTPLIDLIVGVSFLACALAMTNAATRVAFAMSREGVLGEVFGRVSARGVPALGGIMLASTVTAVPLLVIAFGGVRDDMRSVTSPTATIGFLTTYALVCLAAPFFLGRIGELTVRAVVTAGLPFVALIMLTGFYIASAEGRGPAAALAMLAVIWSVGMLRLARRPGLARRVGLHDWPVNAESIEGSTRPRA